MLDGFVRWIYRFEEMRLRAFYADDTYARKCTLPHLIASVHITAQHTAPLSTEPNRSTLRRTATRRTQPPPLIHFTNQPAAAPIYSSLTHPSHSTPPIPPHTTPPYPTTHIPALQMPHRDIASVFAPDQRVAVTSLMRQWVETVNQLHTDGSVRVLSAPLSEADDALSPGGE